MSPDTRRHRGPHPEDRRLFAAERLPDLRRAVEELSWLLSRGYPDRAALKLVGDRYTFDERQRTAVSRAACSDASLVHRSAARQAPEAVRGKSLAVDGFNLIITLEAALSGGALLACRDGCLRDLSGIHGSYRSVEETGAAIRLAGEALAALEPASVRWLLDSPVSNSGRLAARLRETAAGAGWMWEVETVFNPDRELAASGSIVVSSDSAVLDACGAWLDLARPLVRNRLPRAWILDLDPASTGPAATAPSG